MKFSCDRQSFAHALDIVSRIIDTNVTLPVLNNILIKAEGGRIHFSATNLEMAIHYWIKADIKNEGAATVPARLISGYIGLLADSDLSIEMKAGLSMAIDSASSKTRIKCIDADEFPSITELADYVKLSIATEKLPEAISQVAFAAASNAMRPTLAGVYLESDNSKLTMVATDSYRLSEKILKLNSPSEKISCIVPTRAVTELARLCALEEKMEELTILVGKNQIMFQLGEISFYSRLIEGKFPNYKPIIPGESKSTAAVDTQDLLRLIKRVNLFAKENDNKVVLDFGKEKLTVSTPATQIGEEEGILPISLSGEPEQIALNSDFIAQILGHIASSQVELSLNDKSTPALFREAQDPGFLHLIMPLKM